MGLVNAMAVWSRFIDTVMEKHQHQCVLCYADDCLIFTKTESVDDHIADIRKVFDQLEAYGIKIKASKIVLGRKSMPFLGIVIAENGMTPNPEKVKGVKELQPPQDSEAAPEHIRNFCVLSKIHPKF